MPYINVNDAYILDNTGKQVDDAVDYALANSNRNLLDNPFFTVNQRGFTSVTDGNGAPLVDRWKAYHATVVLNTDNSMTVTPTSAQYGISQFIEASRLKVGQTYTMSALVNGEILSASFVYNTTPASSYFATFSNGIRFYRHYANGVVDFWVIRSTTEAFVVQAVKLERGAYSTLANDDVPNYAEELAKCQYYCRVIQGTSFIAVGQAVAATVIRFPLPYVMRARPTATLTGTAQVYGKGGPLTPSALSCTGNTTQGIEISATVSGATSTQSYMLVFSGANDKIVISADL